MGVVEPSMVARSQQLCDILHGHEIVRSLYEADSVLRWRQYELATGRRNRQGTSRVTVVISNWSTD